MDKQSEIRLLKAHLETIEKQVKIALRDLGRKSPQYHEDVYGTICTYARYAFASSCILDRIDEEDVNNK